MNHESTDPASIRASERAALLRLAREVAGRAARAAGYKDAAEVSEDFIVMVLTEAFAARDMELGSSATSRAGADDEPHVAP